MVNHVILSNSFDKVVQVENIGIEDTFGQTGSADELLQYYELTSERIVKEAVGLLQ